MEVIILFLWLNTSVTTFGALIFFGACKFFCPDLPSLVAKERSLLDIGQKWIDYVSKR